MQTTTKRITKNCILLAIVASTSGNSLRSVLSILLDDYYRYVLAIAGFPWFADQPPPGALTQGS
jgi:hypothetical protein